MGYYSGKMFNRESELKKSAIAVFEYDEISGSICIDSTGVNNGTYLGTYTLNQNGRIGQSLLSTSSYFLRSTNNRKFTPEGSKSWNIWINFNTLPSGVKFLFSLKSATQGACQCYFENGYLCFLIGDGITNNLNYLLSKINISSLLMSTSVWYMFTITYTGGHSNSALKIYFNANLPNTTNTTVGTFSGCTYNPNLLFTDGFNSAYGILGYRDQLSIFDKELSLTEIQKLYNNGNGIPYSQF